MLLNRLADGSDWNELQRADFIFAGAVHLIVIVLIVIVSWWQAVSEPEPLPRIEVQMISAKELAKLQEPARQQRKPVDKKTPAPTPKLETSKKKPVPAKEEFDPFAPMQSDSDVKTSDHASTSDMADIMGKQLSRQEIDRYIAMMQKAVEQKWKVPAGVESDTPDPLVEMVLNRDGSVASARIISSSGNKALDDTLISAIYAAAPFQIPAQQFEVFRVNQIRFRPLK